MGIDQDESLKRLDDALKSETQLHWQRNNYFLVVASILILGLSQFVNQIIIQILVSLLALVLSFGWLLITYRSSKYIEYWKARIRELEKQTGRVSIYDASVRGVEMRKVAHVLPVAFFILWLLVILALVF
jgi:Ca2+/Na+ antiporter